MRQAPYFCGSTLMLPWNFKLLVLLLVTLRHVASDDGVDSVSDDVSLRNHKRHFSNNSTYSMPSGNNSKSASHVNHDANQNNSFAVNLQTNTSGRVNYNTRRENFNSGLSQENGSLVEIYYTFGSRVVRPEWTETKDLAFLPGIMVICFLVLIVLRMCKWYRENSKFEERGCSYDVTSYLILQEGDKDYLSVEESVCNSIESLQPRKQHHNNKVYSTITSSRSLQHRIDSHIYDTATSYKSYLQKLNQQNDEKTKLSSAVPRGITSCKPANPSGNAIDARKSSPKLVNSPKEIKKLSGIGRKNINRDSLRSVIPVIDNYMRLKRDHARPTRLVKCGEPRRISRFEVQTLKMRAEMGSNESTNTSVSSCTSPSTEKIIRTLPLKVSYNPVVHKLSRIGARARTISLNDEKERHVFLDRKPRSRSVGTDNLNAPEVGCYRIPENNAVVLVDSWVQSGCWLQKHHKRLLEMTGNPNRKMVSEPRGNQENNCKQNSKTGCKELYDPKHETNGIVSNIELNVLHPVLNPSRYIRVEAEVHSEVNGVGKLNKREANQTFMNNDAKISGSPPSVVGSVTLFGRNAEDESSVSDTRKHHSSSYNEKDGIPEKRPKNAVIDVCNRTTKKGGSCDSLEGAEVHFSQGSSHTGCDTLTDSDFTTKVRSFKNGNDELTDDYDSSVIGTNLSSALLKNGRSSTPSKKCVNKPANCNNCADNSNCDSNYINAYKYETGEDKNDGTNYSNDKTRGVSINPLFSEPEVIRMLTIRCNDCKISRHCSFPSALPHICEHKHGGDYDVTDVNCNDAFRHSKEIVIAPTSKSIAALCPQSTNHSKTESCIICVHDC